MASYTSFSGAEETDVGHSSISNSAQYVTPDSKIYLQKSQNVPV
jgi:hypothetical protein